MIDIDKKEFERLSGRLFLDFITVFIGLLLSFAAVIIFIFGYQWASWIGLCGLAVLSAGLMSLREIINLFKVKENYSTVICRVRQAYFWIIAGLIGHVGSSLACRFGYSFADWFDIISLLIVLVGVKDLYSHVMMLTEVAFHLRQ